MTTKIMQQRACYRCGGSEGGWVVLVVIVNNDGGGKVLAPSDLLGVSLSHL